MSSSSSSTATPSAADAPQSIHGHCACGALRYTIDVSNLSRDLALSAFCHCASCQRLNGTPFIWTSHWLYRAVTWDPPATAAPPGAPDASDAARGFSPAMQTFESIKGRKWKLRCRTCGSPLGSWNAPRQKWTIWPPTLARKAPSTGAAADGPFDVPDDVMAAITAKHHQFYGPWRALVVRDGLDKWTGYAGESEQLSDEGQALRD